MLELFEKAQLEYEGQLLGDIQFRITGINTLSDFGRYKPGAGQIKGELVSTLVGNKGGLTTLVRRSGDRIPISVFGLMEDEVTATVVVTGGYKLPAFGS
jgi:hypothetical protein